jgi:hypothetical protein
VERGWGFVAAAIYEAVDSGSAFVAPKRVREIVRRWLRDGLPADLARELTVNASQGSDRLIEAGSTISDSNENAHPFWVAEAGIGSVQLWAAVVDLVARDGAVRPAEIHDYLKPAVLLERTGESSLRLGVPHELARQRIEHRWRGNLEDALARLIGGAGWELDIQVMSDGSRKSA